MFRKKVNKILVFMLILIIAFVGKTLARQIKELVEFKVTYIGNNTGKLLKEGPDNSPFVVNLRPCRELSPIKIHATLYNAYNKRRSKEHVGVECGDRKEFDNWASRGYLYYVRLARENIWDGAIAITGSWSPDR